MSAVSLASLTGAIQRLTPVDAAFDGSAVNQARMDNFVALAGRVREAFLPPKSVSLKHSNERGFTATQQIADMDIYPFCQALALTTGINVTIVGIDGASQTIRPPAVRVLPPQPYYPLSAVDQMIELAGQRLINSVYGREPAPLSSDDIESIIAASEFGRFAKLAETRFGLSEVRFGNDLSIIGDRRFFELLEQLASSTSVARVTIQPTADGIARKVFDVLGNDFPWIFDPATEGTVHRLRYEASAVQDSQTVELLAQRLSLFTGGTVKAVPAQLIADKKLLRSPTQNVADSLESVPMQAHGKYLYASSQGASAISNILNVEVPFSLQNESLARFLTNRPSNNGHFLSYSSRRGPKVAASEYVEGLRELARELSLPTVDLQLRQGGLTITLPRPEAIANFNGLEIFLDYLEATRGIIQGNVNIVRPQDDTAVAQFLARHLGMDTDWSFDNSGSILALKCRSGTWPDKLSFLAERYLGKKVAVSRNPEPFSGEIVQPRTHMPESRIWDNLRPISEGIAQLLPVGLGSDPAVRLDGNRLIVYTQTLELPDRYLENVREDLYGVGIPVVFRNDYQAAKVDGLVPIVDIVKRSLPSDAYFGGIRHEDNQYVIRLYQRAALSRDLEKVITQIQRCSGYPLRFEVQQSSPQLENLFETATDERSRRFFARAIVEGRKIESVSRLRSIFLEEFDQSVAPQNIRNREDASRVYTVKDFTDLHCFTIDNKDTQLREDALSIKHSADGTIEFGIHIVNAAHAVPYGSVADVMAERAGLDNSFELGGERIPFHVLPHFIRRGLNLEVGEQCEVFSLFFRTDSRFGIINGSQRIDIGAIKNKQIFSYEEIDGGRVNSVEIEDLENFCRANPNYSWSSISPSASQIPARAMVGSMVNMFNQVMGDTLLSAGIEVPMSFSPGSHERDFIKFTGPGRNYNALLAQRQLESHIADRTPLSAERIQFHEERQGFPASMSSAAEFLKRVFAMSQQFPNSDLFIDRQGTVQLGNS